MLFSYMEKYYIYFFPRINKNIHAITIDSSLINDTDFIGTSMAGIASIVSISISNTISIDPSHSAKPN